MGGKIFGGWTKGRATTAHGRAGMSAGCLLVLLAYSIHIYNHNIRKHLYRSLKLNIRIDTLQILLQSHVIQIKTRYLFRCGDYNLIMKLQNQTGKRANPSKSLFFGSKIH
jgi:hypothetical protein